MLCANEIIDIDCPVNTTAGEFACVRLSDIRLDITRIQELIEPILTRLVDPIYNNGTFDEIAKPLEELEKRLPGFSDVAEVSIQWHHHFAFLNPTLTVYPAIKKEKHYFP